MSPRTGPTADVAELVLVRADYRCEHCGIGINGPIGFSRQHRVARGMGGTRAAWINRPSNLLVMCGSATTGCHQLAESRDPAMHGWWLHRHENPLTVPVTLHDGRRVLLDDEGCYLELAA